MSLRPRPRFVLAAAAALVATSLTATAASAVLIEVEFTGIVPAVPADLEGGPVAAGSPVTGRFVYDTSVTNSSALAGVGNFADAVKEFDVTLGGYSIGTTVPTLFQSRNDQQSIPNPFDSFLVNATSGLVGDTINGFSPNRLQWGTFSTDLTRILDETVIPDIDGLFRFEPTDSYSNFNFVGFAGTQPIRWNQQTITATIIPEPGTALLLGLGLAGLAGARRSRA